MPKIKTNRATAKRFKVTGTGRIKRRRAFLRHININKTPKQRRRLGKSTLVDPSNAPAIRRLRGQIRSRLGEGEEDLAASLDPSGRQAWSKLHGNLTSRLVVPVTRPDGTTEDHDLKNGVHFADYIRRVDVPGSKFAYQLRGQQLRYLAITPKKKDTIETIELVKGPDRTAPVVMAVTVEPGE